LKFSIEEQFLFAHCLQNKESPHEAIAMSQAIKILSFLLLLLSFYQNFISGKP
jgi:hypothetical protein